MEDVFCDSRFRHSFASDPLLKLEVDFWIRVGFLVMGLYILGQYRSPGYFCMHQHPSQPPKQNKKSCRYVYGCLDCV